MLRHGAYISVYANLKSASVSRGQKVSTRQILGVVGIDNILQFQLRKERTKLNPEAWLGRSNWKRVPLLITDSLFIVMRIVVYFIFAEEKLEVFLLPDRLSNIV